MKAIRREASELKESKIKFIGKYPPNWNIIPLHVVADIKGRIGYRGYTTDDLVDVGDGPITLSPTNIIDGKISLEKCSYLSWEKYYESPEIMLNKGDIVFVKTASVGKCAIYDADLEATINPQFVVLKNFHVNNKFLFYIMLSEVIQTQVQLDLVGGVLKTITQTDLSRYKILLPDEYEQEVIANYLDDRCSKIDAIIAEAKASIEEYKELKQAVIYEAVTKGVHGDKQYSKMQLKYLVSCNDETLSENTSNEYTFEYIEIGSVEYGKGIITTETVSFKDAPSRARRVVKDGDVIISTVRTYLKAIAEIHYNDTPQIASTGFAVLRAHSINNRYLYYAVLAEDFIQKIEANSVGISYPAITASKLISIKIPVPPKTEQEEIVSYLEPKIQYIDKLIDEKHTLIKDLESYKKSLIYEVVTGKRKVVE